MGGALIINMYAGFGELEWCGVMQWSYVCLWGWERVGVGGIC